MVTWPKSSINPVSHEAKDNYLSSLTYADAMMAINTTAMIEAALLGKPVFTLLGTPLEPNQTGTHHFRHLLNDGKGILARNLVDGASPRLAGPHSGWKGSVLG